MIVNVRLTGVAAKLLRCVSIGLLMISGLAAQTSAANAPGQRTTVTTSNKGPASSVTVRYAAGSKITLPVLITENGILFLAKVNDSPDPLYFTIDSGAAATYFDTETAKRLGMIPSGQGNVQGAGEGTVKVQHLKNVRFELPGLTTVHPEINTADLSGLANQGWGHPISGFFGYDFIRQFVMTIDYDSAVLTLSDPGAFKYHGSGQILPIDFMTKRPYIPGTIKVPGVPATKALFMIDCTSSDGVNHQVIKKSTGPLKKTQAGVGLGRPTEQVVGRVEYFELGKFIIRGAPSVPWGDEGETTGQIGSAILKRFKVIFNYSKSQLILEPGKLYGQPFPEIAALNPATAVPDPTPLQEPDKPVFRWSGAVAPGKTVVLRGSNGSIDASLSESEALYVEAFKSGPAGTADRVRVAVSENADGILICAVPNGEETESRHEKESCDSSSLPKEVRIDFKLLVPAGVALVAHNVNGSVTANSLRSRVDAVTLDGDVSISTTDAITFAQTGNGSLDLAMGQLWTGLLSIKTQKGDIRLRLPHKVSFQPSDKGKTLITGSGPVRMKGIAVSDSQSAEKGAAPELEISTRHGSVTIGTVD